MQKYAFMLLAAILILPSCSSQNDDQILTLINGEQAYEMIENDPELIVIDLRTPEEVAEGTIPGTDLFIDFYDDDFQTQLLELDPTGKYLIYCRSGNRSGQTLDILETAGFSEVYDLEGGITAWSF